MLAWSVVIIVCDREKLVVTRVGTHRGPGAMSGHTSEQKRRLPSAGGLRLVV